MHAGCRGGDRRSGSVTVTATAPYYNRAGVHDTSDVCTDCESTECDVDDHAECHGLEYDERVEHTHDRDGSLDSDYGDLDENETREDGTKLGVSLINALPGEERRIATRDEVESAIKSGDVEMGTTREDGTSGVNPIDAMPGEEWGTVTRDGNSKETLLHRATSQ